MIKLCHVKDLTEIYIKNIKGVYLNLHIEKIDPIKMKRMYYQQK